MRFRLPLTLLIIAGSCATAWGEEAHPSSPASPVDRETIAATAWNIGVIVPVLAGALAAAGIVLTVMRLTRGQARGANSCPARLFKELCQAQRLDARQQRALKQAAAVLQLENPALLFVLPEKLQAAWQATPQVAERREFRDLWAAVYGPDLPCPF